MELILGMQNVTYSKAPFESYQTAFHKFPPSFVGFNTKMDVFFLKWRLLSIMFRPRNAIFVLLLYMRLECM